MPRFHSLRIAHVADETRDAVVITFEVPEAQREAFRFTPGQHVTLRTLVSGEEIRRSYSICSAPHEAGLRIAIKRVPDGLFSTWAQRELRPGHRLEVMEPSGSFGIPRCAVASGGRHHLAFAAGSGITPILSILKTVLAEEPQARATLVYGNRASSAVLFKEELQNLKDRYMARLNLIFVLSREHQDVDLFNGRIDREKTDALLQQWIDPADIDVAYLCGPQSMMSAVTDSLLAHGVGKERIRQELFGIAGQPITPRLPTEAQAAGECSVSVLLDGRERHFTMARDRQTLLDAALDQGVELPYSCKGGVCSTCRCKLIRGEVDMDVHFALEDYEIARGFILTCQSYPRTQEIALNFDGEG